MTAFIQDNLVWLVPIACIILTIAIKASAKPEFLGLGLSDFLDFGFDLSITSLVIFVTGLKNAIDSMYMLFAVIVLVFASVMVNRFGWDRSTESIKFFPGVLIPDIIGIVFLVLSTMYVGGKL